MIMQVMELYVVKTRFIPLTMAFFIFTIIQLWNCPSIYTEVFSYGMVQQQSNLIDEDFEYLEGGYSASFYRDTNSIGSLINGDDLKGSYLVMQLQVTNGHFFSYLANALVRYILSPVLMR